MKKSGANKTRRISTLVTKILIRVNKVFRSEFFKRCLEVGILFAAIASFLANAFAAYYQHGTNKIYNNQLNVSKDTEQRTLRAYIHVDGDHFSYEGGPGIQQSIKATFKVTNDGITPAHNVTVASAFYLIPYPLGKRLAFKIDTTPNPHAGPGLYLAAHASQVPEPNKFEGTLSEDQLKEICKTNSAYRLYLLGTVNYLDIFNIERRVNFCFAYGGPNLSPAVGLAQDPTKPVNASGIGQIYEYDPYNNYEY